MTEVTITPGPLRKIHISDEVLTIDVARQLDEITISVVDGYGLNALDTIQSYRPIARIRAAKHAHGVELLGFTPGRGELIRITIFAGHFRIKRAKETTEETETRDAPLEGIRLAGEWATNHLPLAVLPRSTTDQG